MPSYRVRDLAVSIGREGAGGFAKATFPIRFGRYSEIRTPEYEFHFNLRGEVRFIRGLGPTWRHPGELLKRTDGNDWVYYSLGSVGAHIVRWLGEYYLPCPVYPTNAVYEFNPFTDPNVMRAHGAWSQLYADIYMMPPDGLPEPVREFFGLIKANDDNTLLAKAKQLQAIIGGRPSVLPPDTRHVDYEVIPINIADGCRYHCGFCCVKSRAAFKPRARDDVRRQIRELKGFYGPDLGNYKGLFLGDHDGLGAGDEVVIGAAAEAVEAFGTKDPALFLFASVDSLLEAGERVFAELDRLAGHTYINIGLESVHGPTLAAIRKPLDPARVRAAFQRMLAINRDYQSVEITANFLLGEQFPAEHIRSLTELLEGALDRPVKKGAVYFSPLLESRNKEELLKTYFEIKERSKLPAYIYLIQRH